ncbi:MAG TPA: HAD-IA family hydrolase [Pseudonocardiaceae bacterium]|jgi:putative hydrolase of the HAD superfamily
MTDKVLALDAMGVLYRDADDVADLLVPYLRERGCRFPVDRIEAEYTRCSLGEFPAAALWQRLGVAGDDEEYCARHELTPGMAELLADSAGQVRLSCLSNDVAEWSVLLRRRFGLERWIDTWVISAEIGHRKPARAAYLSLLDAVDARPDEVLFVDDRERNLVAARELGITAVPFAGTDRLAEVVREWS